MVVKMMVIGLDTAVTWIWHPFTGRFDWTPDWMVRIRLLPFSWVSRIGSLRDRYEHPEYY